jgi:putative DNA primase/helicase
MLSNPDLKSRNTLEWEFKDFIAEHFPESSIPDYIKPGAIFRFGKNSIGWGILFEDYSGGIVGDWRSGDRHVWQSAKSKKTPYEREQFAMQIAKAKAAEDIKRELEYMKVEKRCEELFNSASFAPDNHPYLMRKRVKGYGLKIHKNGSLLVPVCSVPGNMQSIQSIDSNGQKRFHTGGKVAGGCHMIGSFCPDKSVIICEGYATGASLYEDGNPYVVIAFNSGNLLSIAIEIKRYLSPKEIIIAGDDDWQTAGNPGKTAAIKAANAIDGKVLFPQFGPDRHISWTDFNDLICAVKVKI